jgi:hypothetical protein
MNEYVRSNQWKVLSVEFWVLNLQLDQQRTQLIWLPLCAPCFPRKAACPNGSLKVLSSSVAFSSSCRPSSWHRRCPCLDLYSSSPCCSVHQQASTLLMIQAANLWLNSKWLNLRLQRAWVRTLHLKCGCGLVGVANCPLLEALLYCVASFWTSIRCPEFGGCPFLGGSKCTSLSIGALLIGRFSEVVCLWEGPLREVPLYKYNLAYTVPLKLNFFHTTYHHTNAWN